MLVADARRAEPRDQARLDLMRLDMDVTVVTEKPGTEHVVIAENNRRLRLELRGDSVLDGPVRLRFAVATDDLDQRLVALRRMSGLLRGGRLLPSLYPADPVLERRVLALQAWDAAQAGASQRRIVAKVLGASLVRGDLTDERRFNSLRMRVARLIVQADARIEIGRRRFLAG